MLSVFWQCPRRFYHTKIKKDVIDRPSGPAIDYGNYVHKAMERRLDMGAALPKDLKRLEKLCASLLAMPGTKTYELELAFTEALELVDWFAKTVWLRVKIDFLNVHEETALVLDWKTGKRKNDDRQLALYGAAIFAAYPFVERVIAGYVWTEDKQNPLEKLTFTRPYADRLWNKYLPTVRQVHACLDLGEWKPKPSGLCQGWCPVQSCEFWQPKET